MNVDDTTQWTKPRNKNQIKIQKQTAEAMKKSVLKNRCSETLLHRLITLKV